MTSGERNGNLFQYSCLENPMDGGAWWATVHGIKKNQPRLSDFTFTFTFIMTSLHLALGKVRFWTVVTCPEYGSMYFQTNDSYISKTKTTQVIAPHPSHS